MREAGLCHLHSGKARREFLTGEMGVRRIDGPPALHSPAARAQRPSLLRRGTRLRKLPVGVMGNPSWGLMGSLAVADGKGSLVGDGKRLAVADGKGWPGMTGELGPGSPRKGFPAVGKLFLLFQ